MVVADEQTAGRGRRGRVWFSPIGNLFCSILLDPGPEPARSSELVFVAAVALREALEAVTPGANFVCKWPNDILCDGAKVSGMLLEMAQPFVILGVGVNVVAGPPADMQQYPATCLADAGSKADAQTVCAAFGDRLEFWYDTWRTEGFGPMRQVWIDHAAGIGKPVTVRLADTTVLEGNFGGLDAHGALLLDTADGKRQPVMAGDVFFAA
jgi:BirA family biotin operon repressor/biotin-[acetyl-CoA-carboxylase] ligase